jgi:predicted nucleic acid-binding protein
LTRVLIDSSVWVAHFRRVNCSLQSLLAADHVLCHPLIVIEIACGTPPTPRERTLADLKRLRASTIATTDEILALIEAEDLADSGCGVVDMAILASVRLTPDALLWTVDKNLDAVATRLGLDFRAASARFSYP